MIVVIIIMVCAVNKVDYADIFVVTISCGI